MRAEILEVTQRQLMSGGPASIRLDDVAGELGVSRQAILHHFVSREGLLRAVVGQAWLGLFDDLAQLAQSADGMKPEAFVDLVDHVVRERGNARLGAWLLLSGQGLPQAVFDGAVAQLPATVGRGPAAKHSEEDARNGLLLVAAALFGDAIFGERLRQALGAPDGPEERKQFRRWLANRVWASTEG
jgi:AcrR family transcriptional regulator